MLCFFREQRLGMDVRARLWMIAQMRYQLQRFIKINLVCYQSMPNKAFQLGSVQQQEAEGYCWMWVVWGAGAVSRW